MSDRLDRQYVVEQVEKRLLYAGILFSQVQASDREDEDALLFPFLCQVSVIEALLGIAIADVVGGFDEPVRVGDKYAKPQKIGLTEDGEDLFLCVRRDERKKVNQVNLQVLIDIAHQEKIVTKSDRDVLHRLREVRNSVHLMNTGVQLVEKDISAADSMVKKLHAHIRAVD